MCDLTTTLHLLMICFQATYDAKNIPSTSALLFRYAFIYLHCHTCDSTLMFSTAMLLSPLSLTWVYNVSLLV